MKTHELKIWPEFFAAVLDGRKTYEIRRDDRGFAVGDRLLLREWDPWDPWDPCRSCSAPGDVRCDSAGGIYTGRELLVEVTYLTLGGGEWLAAGLCMMAIRKVEPDVAARVEEQFR